MSNTDKSAERFTFVAVAVAVLAFLFLIASSMRGAGHSRPDEPRSNRKAKTLEELQWENPGVASATERAALQIEIMAYCEEHKTKSLNELPDRYRSFIADWDQRHRASGDLPTGYLPVFNRFMELVHSTKASLDSHGRA